MPSGYSGTPLVKKLGIKENHSLLLYNHPKNYLELFDELPSSLEFLKKIKPQSADFIHLFFDNKKELNKNFLKFKNALKKDRIIWVSWPKGSSEIYTDFKRDFVREYILNLGLVDVKVAAIDNDWSGLKFVYRKKDR